MIELTEVTKEYSKGVSALHGINLKIKQGEFVFIVGDSGSGKSTLIRLIMKELEPTSGTIIVNGQNLGKLRHRKIPMYRRGIGVVFQDFRLLKDRNIYENIAFAQRVVETPTRIIKKKVPAALSLVGLAQKYKSFPKELSGGEQQRVAIARALYKNASLIILDEPTVGLDPIQIIEIRDLIKELGQTHTVIFSSHILSEVQTICDQIIMIAKGKLVAFDTPENLEQHLLTPNEVILTTDASANEVQTLLEGISNITELSLEEPDSGLVTARIKTDLSDVYQISRAVFSAFAASGNTLLELAVKKANLEDIFLELADNDAAAPELPVVEGEPVESEVPEE